VNDAHWKELLSGDEQDRNSHANVLPEYRRMLQALRQSKDQHRLTAEDIARVAAARTVR
jgi:uncharacterized protein YfbU (UPF0304 family)